MKTKLTAIAMTLGVLAGGAVAPVSAADRALPAQQPGAGLPPAGLPQRPARQPVTRNNKPRTAAMLFT